MLVGAIFGWQNVYLITVSFIILPSSPSSIPCWPPGIQWMMMRCWCPGAKATSAPQSNWNTRCAPAYHFCHDTNHQSSSFALLGLTRVQQCIAMLLQGDRILNLAETQHGENFTRQFSYAKFKILSLYTQQKNVCNKHPDFFLKFWVASKKVFGLKHFCRAKF